MRIPPSSKPPLAPKWRLSLRTVCRYLLAAVFLMAALGKITDLRSFTDEVLSHSGMPAVVAHPVAAVLPWLELTCGLCLAFGYAAREAACLTAFLLVLFTVYSLVHSPETDCQCFLWPPRSATIKVWWWHPLQDVILFLCSVWVAWRQASNP